MMAKQFNSKSRVFLKKDACRDYFIAAQKNLQMSQTDLSRMLGVSPRTYTAWKSAETSFPYETATVFKKKARVPLPHTAKIEQNPYWYTFKGGPLGAKRVHELYGASFSNTPHRRAQWLLWWKEKGQYRSVIGKRKTVTLPPYSKELAEFVGIMLGDGGITKYQIKITLNSIDDAEYSQFVLKLIKKLFGVSASITFSKNSRALNVSVSRRELVIFCNTKLGLPTGHKIKHAIDIPKWIYRNKQFALCCIRGLVDTDGSLFWEKHASGVSHSYPRLNFTSASAPLIHSVHTLLCNMGFSPKIRRSGRSVQIEKKSEICDYWRTVGSSNPKHQRKLRRVSEGCVSG